MEDNSRKPKIVVTQYTIKTTDTKIKNKSKKTAAPPNKKLAGIGCLVALLILIPFYWFVIQPFIVTPIYSLAFTAPNLTTDFIQAAFNNDEAKMQSLLSSDLKTRFKAEEYAFLRNFSYSHIDWGNRRGYGTTRGGKNTMTLSGYIKFKDRKEESSFSASLIEENGVWLINSISIRPAAIPY
jgi:hypothetical protein